MRRGSGFRFLTTLVCSVVVGAVPASAQQAGGMIAPGRDTKLGPWLAQSQVTQKGAVFQCVVERPLGSGGRKADRIALVIGGGAGWSVQIVRAGWSLDPDKDHDAVILVDGGRTVPVESYALDPNRLAIHPSDVPTFEAYLKRGTTMAVRSRSAGIDEGGLPLDGIGPAIDWLDRCGRQFALYGAPPEGAVAKPLAPVGAPVLAAPAPPPPPAPVPGPAQGPLVVTPPPATAAVPAAVAPPSPAATPPAAAAAPVPTPKPARPATATAATPEPAGSGGKEPGPVAVVPARPDVTPSPMAAAAASPGPVVPPRTSAPAAIPAPTPVPRPVVVAPPPSPPAESRPLAFVPSIADETGLVPVPPPPAVVAVAPKALLPTTPAPAEPAAEAIGRVVRGKTDRAAVVVRAPLPSDGEPVSTGQTVGRHTIEPVVVREERGSIVTAVARPTPEPSPVAAPTPSATTVPNAAPSVAPASPRPETLPAAPNGAVAKPPASAVAPPLTSGAAVVSAAPVPIGSPSAPPAPTGPVRVIQGIAAYPSPYAAPASVAPAASGPTGATAETAARIPFDGPVPKAKPR